MSYFNYLSWYWQAIICIPFLVLSVLFHEQAHYRMLKSYIPSTTRPKFFNMKYVISWDVGSLTVDQEREVYIAGILCGLFPVILILYFVSDWLFYLCLLIYFFGCKHDIKELLLRSGK